MPEPSVLPGVADALALGLTESEYELVCEKQGGPPNVVELAMYSLLWSEHCAYKHSKKLLRTLPTESPHIVLGPGENAGAVDLGDGLVCAFKVESHNHPSAVEPFQGAATGVGGILRDIFAIGARPIAVLDSLRFGEPLGRAFGGNGERSAPLGVSEERAALDAASAARSRYLLNGTVAGIAHYGNSVGVPTVGGEVYFEDPYGQSCLVNAMALGIAPRARLIRSAAAGPGNLLVLFGAATGRDGIGGASVLASAELGHDESGKRPTVQVGDPFEGKKLLECSLQLLDEDLLVSLQDLGAAGLTSSAAEMASKGGVGIELDVAKVPLREADMDPFEIMVSESQERMLCVVEPDRVTRVLEICRRWEVEGCVVGFVTDTGRIRVLRDGEPVGEMPVAALVDDCPLYDLRPEPPKQQIYAPPPAVIAPNVTAAEKLLALLAGPNIASRRPLFEHYDPIVQSRTVRRPGSADAAVLAIRPLRGERALNEEGTRRGAEDRAGVRCEEARIHVSDGDGSPTTHEAGSSLAQQIPGIAVSIDCNGRRVAADPYAGTLAAVLECAANLACVGAESLGVTNNLNFGNPEKPHIAWQLTRAIEGLRDACLALEVAIVGGNVSLYNESASGPIYPTPVIGMVGRLADVRRVCGFGFAHEGDAIALAGPFRPSLAACELAKLEGRPLPTELPQPDIRAVVAAIDAIREAVGAGTLSSAHDIAEGGLAVALAECCLAGEIGAEIAIDPGVVEAIFHVGAEATGSGGANPPAHAGAEVAADAQTLLFGEGVGGFLLSGPEEELRTITAVPLQIVGRVGGERLLIEGGDSTLDVSLAEMARAHSALAELFQ